MKYCSECGNMLKDNAKYCDKCGIKIEIVENIYKKQIENVNQFEYEHQYNVIEEDDTKRKNKENKKKSQNYAYDDKKKKKKGGCLKIVGIAFVIAIALFGVSMFFVGKDNTVDNSQNQNTYKEGDFYNIKAIPVIETNEDLTEYNLAFVIRGICELRLEAMQQAEILYSKEFIEASTKEQWLSKSDEVSDLWTKLEKYSVKFKEELDGLDVSVNNEKLNIFSLLEAPKAYAYTPNEIMALWDQATKIDRRNRLKLFAKHLGVTARDAHKIQQKATQAISKDAGDKADRIEIAERALVLTKIAGQVSSVALAATTGGASSLIKGPVAIITGTDLVMSVGVDSSFVIFGDNPKVKSFVAPIDKLRKAASPVTGVLNLLSFRGDISSLSKDVANIAKRGQVFINSFGLSVDAFQGKFCGIDFSSDGDIEKVSVSKLKMEELDEYSKEKGIKLDITEETKASILKLRDYSELETDTFLAQVEKRQQEFRAKQDKLSKNLDKTLDELYKMAAYDYNNAGGSGEKATKLYEDRPKDNNDVEASIDDADNNNTKNTDLDSVLKKTFYELNKVIGDGNAADSDYEEFKNIYIEALTEEMGITDYNNVKYVDDFYRTLSKFEGYDYYGHVKHLLPDHNDDLSDETNPDNDTINNNTINNDTVNNEISQKEIERRTAIVKEYIKQLDEAFKIDTKHMLEGHEYSEAIIKLIDQKVKELEKSVEQNKLVLKQLKSKDSDEVKGYSGGYARQGEQYYYEDLEAYSIIVNEYDPGVRAFYQKYETGYNKKNSEHLKDYEKLVSVAGEARANTFILSSFEGYLGQVYTYNNNEKSLAIVKEMLNRSIKGTVTRKEIDDFYEKYRNNIIYSTSTGGVIDSTNIHGDHLRGYLESVSK